jgi:hypothetical protein
MAKAKPVKTIHRTVGFVAVRKQKEPRIFWKELEARGAKDVAFVALTADDRLVGLVGPEAKYKLVFADASGLHATKLPAGDWKGLAPRDDGGAVLVYKTDTLVEVAIPSGEARTLDTGAIARPIQSACYAGSCIVVHARPDEDELVLAKRTGDTLEPIATHRPDIFVFEIGGRGGFVVFATDEKEKSRVLAVKGGAFHDVGTLKQAVNCVHYAGKALLVLGMPGTFEIDLESL